MNVGVFTLGFRVATARRLPWRCIVRGAIAAAIAWQLLQYVGTAYIGSVVKHATATNAVFAFVLGLVAWIYLEALDRRARRRVQRRARTEALPALAADSVHRRRRAHHGRRRAYTGLAKSQRAKGFQDINVTFDEPQRERDR